MKTLYMTKGLPASGKTTAAKKMVGDPTCTVKRVNKDDLRAMLDNSRWSESNEKYILCLRDRIVGDILDMGHHCIVDDTNLALKHESQLRQLARVHRAEFKVMDFTHVAVEECIKRDLVRPNSVGSKVILDMYETFLKPKPQVPPPYDENLPSAVICDIDGTIADLTGRGPFEWDKVGQDKPRPIVMMAVRNLVEHNLFFVSGRDAVCENDTRAWLYANYGSDFRGLYMRPEGDQRRDSLVKREIYENHIKGRYNVIAIFDDRPQVIRECWQELGFGDRIFNVGTGEEF